MFSAVMWPQHDHSAGPESVAAGGCQLPTVLTAALRGNFEWHPSVTTEIPFNLR